MILTEIIIVFASLAGITGTLLLIMWLSNQER